MKDSHNNKLTIALGILFLLGFFAVCLLKPTQESSDFERRPLAQMPQATIKDISSGKWMQDFEKYTLDQFPLRDAFRSIKSFFAYQVLRNRDVNDIYIVDGNASKMEYSLSEKSLQHAVNVFQNVYKNYLTEENEVYFAMIPDKNYYMAKENGYLSLDYEAMSEYLVEGLPQMQFIDLTECLDINSYYATDTHWRQEKIVDVANKIKQEMGIYDQIKTITDYSVQLLDNPFYGVYYGQSALPLAPDDLYYLENDVLKECTVYDWETSNYTEIYDMDKAYGKDPYEMFLSGSKSILAIQNPKNISGKRLIAFRDSFGSSIAPLLVDAYSEVILVDIRYIGTPMLGKFIDFSDADVIFLYSSVVLNNGTTLK